MVALHRGEACVACLELVWEKLLEDEMNGEDWKRKRGEENHRWEELSREDLNDKILD